MRENSIITLIDYDSNSNVLWGDTKPLVKEDESQSLAKNFSNRNVKITFELNYKQ